MTIPFLDFVPMHSAIKKEMQSAFESVYDSHWYIMGNHLKQFEKEYAEFSNTKYAIGVSNGLDALILALKALEIGPGDEVVIPANTYIASVLAVSHVGATPVFVEPDLKTYNIDPTRIKEAINERTKAIMPVHLYGQACCMSDIMDIAKTN
jgi:dTDP-4-amino-4,6-dideoxygalactose transaminase